MADPKRVVERHVEAFNARDADAAPWSDDAELVAAEGRFIGTHTGVMRTPAGDVAATGRQVDLRWMSSYQVGQLGLMPTT